MAGRVRDPHRVLLFADPVVERDKPAIPGPVGGQRWCATRRFTRELLRRAAPPRSRTASCGTTDSRGSPYREARSIGRPHRPAMNFRRKRDAPAFSAIGIEGPDTGAPFSALQTVAATRRPSRETRTLPQCASEGARPRPLPCRSGRTISTPRLGKSGLIHQNAVAGHRETGRQIRAVVNDVLRDRKRLAREPETARRRKAGRAGSRRE